PNVCERACVCVCVCVSESDKKINRGGVYMYLCVREKTVTVSVCDRGWGAVSACSGHIPHIPVWIGREPNSIPTPPHWEIEEEEAEGERERDEEREEREG